MPGEIVEQTDALPGLEFQPAEIRVIDRIDELRAIANPLRISMLDLLIAEPRTVKEIGKALGISSTKLYYHVGEMERAGLVRLVHTELQSGILAKYYRATARYYYLSPSLLQTSGSRDAAGSEFLAAHIESGARDLRRAIGSGGIDELYDTFMVSRRVMRMSAERAAKFRAALEEIDREVGDAGDPGEPLRMELLLALFPMPQNENVRK